MSLRAFCENLFFTNRKVGTDVGFPIGRVDNQLDSWKGHYEEAIEASANPVYVNLFQANKLGLKVKLLVILIRLLLEKQDQVNLF
ncbi:hypothetical protein [Streptococcus mutans]|uniref:hypothetical protein n=1 Tax=Streptococcus mutans TaxID=1309 RepID=UPI001D0FBA47|nr:hypothetical protein [Streptococcus mutans]